MRISTVRQRKILRPAVGAALAVLAGLVLWAMPLGDAFMNASYDYLFRLNTFSEANPVVIVFMDNEAYADLGQSREQPWDRSLHTRLFNKLADDGCRLVVPDIFFRSAKDPKVDEAMAVALSRLTNVVLAAEQSKVEHAGLDSARPTLPLARFLNAAQGNWGVAWLDPDLDHVVRHHWPFPSPGPYPSLPWTAATLMGAHLNAAPSEKWIRYYDFNKTWTSLSYHLALVQPPGYFRGKIVFIGSKPATTLGVGGPDEFMAPQTRWTGEVVGGVEILATSFLNLLNGDWLRRLAGPVEAVALVVTGTLLGFLLCWFKRVRTLLVAVLAAVALTYAGSLLSELTNFWFPWLIVVGAQLPLALGWALLVPQEAAKAGVIVPGKTVRVAPLTAETLSAPDETPEASDFEIFQPPVGQGGYGKVWIVRNAIGQWQALKAIYQSKFGDNTLPYEAEFNGLQKYKPVSEKHPGLLRIEMVSKMKSEGYFYYIMELGDALEPGWESNPSSYKPRDLDSLRKRSPGRRLPPDECLRLLIILSEALDFLHRQGLIHRDIKPSNVIFVNNRPKLADIGLVADIRPADRVNTLVGTPGYMPPLPERPGTVQADIYALGMVLYVISTGKEPSFFPEISTTIMERTGHEDFIRLDSIILKACNPDLTRRYPTMALMLEDLRQALGHKTRILE